jgi:hypothetical protein
MFLRPLRRGKPGSLVSQSAPRSFYLILCRKHLKHPPTAETLSNLGLLSVLVRVTSCDSWIGYYDLQKNDPRNYTN